MDNRLSTFKLESHTKALATLQRYQNAYFAFKFFNFYSAEPQIILAETK